MLSDRRTFLQLLASGAAGASILPSITRALEIPAHIAPAPSPTSSTSSS